jgi:hypothetical protein
LAILFGLNKALDRYSIDACTAAQDASRALIKIKEKNIYNDENAESNN